MKTLPQEHITRVDFAKFWEQYFAGAVPHTLTYEDVRPAKYGLLEAGVPTFTAHAYFMQLSRMVANEAGDGEAAGVLETVLFDLESLGHLEEGA